MITQIQWFALQTMPRSEKQVYRHLTQKGYACLLPTYRQKRRWSDRVVESETPLFPSYIFCQFHADVLGKAISTPGVTRIVGFGGKPAEVELEEIEALRLLAKSDCLREPWAYIPEGTKVQVETGPLVGAHGILCSAGEKERLVISVTLLQRSVAVQLDESTALSVIEGPKIIAKGKSLLSHESQLALSLLCRSRN
jgi:transcription antitermination factor NusG